MIRLGLCCTFQEQAIRFRTTTAKATGKLGREEQLSKLAGLIEANALALAASVRFCSESGIGAFRINSQIWPLATHPEVGYRFEELPGADGLRERYEACGALARELDVRLSFHPDQFVVLSSPRNEVVENSLAEIEYQAEVASWLGADVINVHGGGVYGDKGSALERLAANVDRLSDRARERLTLENDDVSYTPSDLLPVCEATGLPLVYDVHHHRCLEDGLSITEATDRARATWSSRAGKENREPLFHLSSPKDGWDGPMPKRHHDFIDPDDVPEDWTEVDLTIDVEAKAKETAVLALRNALVERGVSVR